VKISQTILHFFFTKRLFQRRSIDREPDRMVFDFVPEERHKGELGFKTMRIRVMLVKIITCTIFLYIYIEIIHHIKQF